MTGPESAVTEFDPAPAHKLEQVFAQTKGALTDYGGSPPMPELRGGGMKDGFAIFNVAPFQLLVVKGEKIRDILPSSAEILGVGESLTIHYKLAHWLLDEGRPPSQFIAAQAAFMIGQSDASPYSSYQLKIDEGIGAPTLAERYTSSREQTLKPNSFDAFVDAQLASPEPAVASSEPPMNVRECAALQDILRNLEALLW